jgi:hypothetical protein
MPSPTASYQQYICPEEFQERLTDIGGVNRYDEPNFLLVWSQGGCPQATYRAGGTWAGEGQVSYTGYRDLLIGGGVPCWALMQWHNALEYGTPEIYYVQNYDVDSDLQTLGEYPYHGRYQMLYNLRWCEMRNGHMFFEMMPLNTFLLETVVPIITAAKDISWEQTKAAMRDLKEKEDKADINMIEDVMRSNSLAFKGNAVSYQRQGCRTSLVDKKIETMQRSWNKMMLNANRLGRGINNLDQTSSIAQEELRRRAT